MKRFVIYATNRDYFSYDLQIKCCYKYIRNVLNEHNLSKIDEFDDFDDLISNILKYDKIIILAYFCLGKDVPEIMDKIKIITNLNSNVDLYSVLEEDCSQIKINSLNGKIKNDHICFQINTQIFNSLLFQKNVIKLSYFSEDDI